MCLDKRDKFLLTLHFDPCLVNVINKQISIVLDFELTVKFIGFQ